MVRFDGAGLDDVGIDCSLGQEADALELAGFLLEHADEFSTDDLPLLLGIGYAGELVKETVHCVDIDKVRVQFVAEHLHDLLGFTLTEKTVIDVD